jgi:hypothetical protein
MEETSCLIYNRKAESNEGIDAACDDTVEKKLIEHLFSNRKDFFCFLTNIYFCA